MALEKPKALLLAAAVLFSAALGMDTCVQTDDHRAGVFRDRLKSWSEEKWSTRTVLAERSRVAEWLKEYPRGEYRNDAEFFLIAAWFHVGAYSMMWVAVAAMLLVVLSPLESDRNLVRPNAHRVVSDHDGVSRGARRILGLPQPGPA